MRSPVGAPSVCCWLWLVAMATAACRDGVGPDPVVGPNLSGEPPVPGPTPPPGYSTEQIAYTWTKDNPDGEIYIMSATGKHPTRVTFAPGVESELTWSPDGSRIAFMRKLNGGVFPVFHLMNADGTGQVAYPLSQGSRPAYIRQTRWSPNGAKLLLSTSSCCGDVWTINADGTGAVMISSMDYLRASWSPDGARVVMSSGDVCGGWDLVTKGAEGGGYAVLTPCDDYDSADWAAWRP